MNHELKYKDNQKVHEGLRCILARKQFPHALNEEIIVKAELPEIVKLADRMLLRQDFTTKLAIELEDLDYAMVIAKKNYDNLPDELLINIEEWCRDAPLSNIDYKGITINSIMNWNGINRSILSALRAFKSWSKLGYPNPEEFFNTYYSTI